MTNQFHDILPGSSIHQVFEDCRKTYAEMNSIWKEVREDTLGTLAVGEKDSVTVWNLSAFAHTGPVTVEACPQAAIPLTRTAMP